MDPQRRLARLSALLDMGRLDDAQREALEAVAIGPHDDRLWAALAMVEARRSDYPAVVYAANRALSLERDNVLALHALGPALFHTGESQEARRTMDSLVELAPEWAPALVQRASIYSWTAATEADRRVVRDSCAAALQLDPLNADNLGVLAEALHWIGDSGAAARLLDDGLRLDPDSESLLLKKARFGGLSEPQTLDVARAILAVNPIQVHALRLLHLVTWRRLTRVAGWPPIVGALAAALGYAFFLHGGGPGSRVWLGILLVPAVGVWASMFLGLNAAAPADRLRKVLRAAPLGLLGFCVTVFANLAIVAGVVVLLVLPLGEASALANALGLLAVAAVGSAAGDILLRVGAARFARRTGLFADNPEGRMSARYAARTTGTTGRLITAALVVLAATFALWTPGVAALGAIALAHLATVLAATGISWVLQHRPAAAVWLSLAGVAFAGAVVCLGAQLVGTSA